MPIEADTSTSHHSFEIRSRHILDLKEKHAADKTSLNPYPHKFVVNTRVGEFLKKYEHLKKGEVLRDVEVRMGVRVMQTRASGNSLRFYDCKGEGESLQIFCDLREDTDQAG